jgi:hypothetical protein
MADENAAEGTVRVDWTHVDAVVERTGRLANKKNKWSVGSACSLTQFQLTRMPFIIGLLVGAVAD